MAKTAAQGYSDFYKSNSNTSSSNTDGASVSGSDDSDVEDSTDTSMNSMVQRKKALKKRLLRLKAGN